MASYDIIRLYLTHRLFLLTRVIFLSFFSPKLPVIRQQRIASIRNDREQTLFTRSSADRWLFFAFFLCVYVLLITRSCTIYFDQYVEMHSMNKIFHSIDINQWNSEKADFIAFGEHADSRATLMKAFILKISHSNQKKKTARRKKQSESHTSRYKALSSFNLLFSFDLPAFLYIINEKKNNFSGAMNARSSY